MKKNLLFLVIGFLLASGIGVIAYNYNAKNIEYTPSDSSWNVNNVGDAIDSLKNLNGGVPVLIASDTSCEGANLKYRYTSTKKETIIVTLFASRGKDGWRSISCKKNDVEITEYEERETAGWPILRNYIIEVDKGDYIDVAANTGGSYGDEGYSIFAIR